MKNIRNLTIALISIALLALAVSAFAHGGMGWGGGWGHHGRYHHDGYGFDSDSRMSGEDYARIERQREAFFAETEGIRSQLIERERALQEVLSSETPDAVRASGLQREISDLRAQLDQKRTEHMIELRKQFPDADRGVMRGGPMAGYGPRGGGYCWQR